MPAGNGGKRRGAGIAGQRCCAETQRANPGDTSRQRAPAGQTTARHAGEHRRGLRGHAEVTGNARRQPDVSAIEGVVTGAGRHQLTVLKRQREAAVAQFFGAQHVRLDVAEVLGRDRGFGVVELRRLGRVEQRNLRGADLGGRHEHRRGRSRLDAAQLNAAVAVPALHLLLSRVDAQDTGRRAATRGGEAVGQAVDGRGLLTHARVGVGYFLADVGHGAAKEGATRGAVGGLGDVYSMAQCLSGEKRATGDGGEKALTNKGGACGANSSLGTKYRIHFLVSRAT